MSGDDMVVTITQQTKAGSIVVAGTAEWNIQVSPVLCETLTVMNGAGTVAFYDAMGVGIPIVNVSGTFHANAESIYADSLKCDTITVSEVIGPSPTISRKAPDGEHSYILARL